VCTLLSAILMLIPFLVFTASLLKWRGVQTFGICWSRFFLTGWLPLPVSQTSAVTVKQCFCILILIMTNLHCCNCYPASAIAKDSRVLGDLTPPGEMSGKIKRKSKTTIKLAQMPGIAWAVMPEVLHHLVWKSF